MALYVKKNYALCDMLDFFEAGPKNASHTAFFSFRE